MSEDELDVVIEISKKPTSRELELLFIIARLDVTLIKKDKVIDLMTELLCSIDVKSELGEESWNWNKEQMKEYFLKKAEEDDESNI